MTDQDVADQIKLLRQAGVTVHIRGDDTRPVIEFKDNRTRRVVGGIELRKRLAK